MLERKRKRKRKEYEEMVERMRKRAEAKRQLAREKVKARYERDFAKREQRFHMQRGQRMRRSMELQGFDPDDADARGQHGPPRAPLPRWPAKERAASRRKSFAPGGKLMRRGSWCRDSVGRGAKWRKEQKRRAARAAAALKAGRRPGREGRPLKKKGETWALVNLMKRVRTKRRAAARKADKSQGSTDPCHKSDRFAERCAASAEALK
eukprot:gene48191-17818_t